MHQSWKPMLIRLAAAALIAAAATSATRPACGDLNSDGVVDVNDLLVMAQCVGGTCTLDPTPCGAAPPVAQNACGDVFRENPAVAPFMNTNDLAALGKF